MGEKPVGNDISSCSRIFSSLMRFSWEISPNYSALLIWSSNDQFSRKNLLLLLLPCCYQIFFLRYQDVCKTEETATGLFEVCLDVLKDVSKNRFLKLHKKLAVSFAKCFGASLPKETILGKFIILNTVKKESNLFRLLSTFSGLNPRWRRSILAANIDLIPFVSQKLLLWAFFLQQLFFSFSIHSD